MRALDAEGGEVARKDFRFDQPEDRVDEVVVLRTTSRASAVELLGCTGGGSAALSPVGRGAGRPPRVRRDRTVRHASIGDE